VSSHVQQLSAAARQAVQANNWAQVKTCARAILDRSRDNAEGYFLLGLVEKAANRIEPAIKSFTRAIRSDDSRYDAAVELAAQLLRAARHREATALLQRYEPLLNNSPVYLDMAGTVYTNAGFPEKAWPLYMKANELQPGIDILQANLAACSVFVGKIDEAQDIYRQLLKKIPNHQRNHYELSRLARATNNEHVDAMTGVLKSTSLPPERNIYIYYAIGKELEDLERWDEAFEYYKRAGDAARSVADYDVQTDIKLIDKVIEVCNADWIADEPNNATIEATPDASQKTPVFVVGLPRTGTTLTERILTSHSMVESVGESFFMQSVIKRESRVMTTDSMNPGIVEATAKKDIQRIARGYMEAIEYRFGDKPFFIEKFPENFLYLGFIAKAFPDAKIVHLKRDPMDTCFAMFKQSFFRYAYSLDDLGRYYVAYHRLYEHWRTLLGERMIEVEYEQLVSDQEPQTRSLLDKLGLGFEEACLNFEKNKSASNTASTVQIREKIHGRSVRRWKRFEKQLEPLRNYLENAGISVD
jgi:tetratricopeptide (TPR) repeat protein